MQVRNGGRLTLADGTIILRTTPASSDERRRYARRNERAPLSEPIAAQHLRGDELLRAIRRNLRQPPRSKQSRDTTQSVFHCLYEDCQSVTHADQNAAINIGRRFLTENVALVED